MAAQFRNKLLLLLILAALVAAVAWFSIPTQFKAPTDAEATVPPQGPVGISCLGRIQPEDSLVIIGARSLSGQASLVSQLRVKEGEYIKAGHTIAVLDSLPQLEAAWHQAESRVKVADARLKQVMAGAKPAEVAAQQAEIARLEVELSNAKTIYSRTDTLFKNGIAPESSLDRDRMPVDSLTQAIVEAKERLRALEVRQVDVDLAMAELQAAEAETSRAKVEADAAIVRAPYNGIVLKIHAWQGQEVGAKGILELAKVDRMYVIAEVAESDIQRVKLGQRARITGYSLPQPQEGQVERLGLKVSRNSLVVDNPVNLTDARIVEVRIRLDDGSQVRSLIDAQVEVVITP